MDPYQNVNAPKFSSSKLHSLLDGLLDAYKRKGMDSGASLLPAIDESELKEKCKWFPSVLPPEIISLYGWRGGQEKDASESEYPFWFRDMSFCSIKRAEIEYKSMMNTYGATPENHELLKSSFPFASFNGGWYVFPSREQRLNSNLKNPIICVLQGIDIYYYSIESMVNTCIEWVDNGMYDENYTLPENIENDIWQKYNPKIFELKT